MLLSFNKMFNFCIDCTYLLVKRVNAVGANSNFSSQLPAEFHCVSPIIYWFVCIQYHVIVSSDILPYELRREKMGLLPMRS